MCRQAKVSVRQWWRYVLTGGPSGGASVHVAEAGEISRFYLPQLLHRFTKAVVDLRAKLTLIGQFTLEVIVAQAGFEVIDVSLGGVADFSEEVLHQLHAVDLRRAGAIESGKVVESR